MRELLANAPVVIILLYIYIYIYIYIYNFTMLYIDYVSIYNKRRSNVVE